MSTGAKWMKCSSAWLLGAAILCGSRPVWADTASSATQNQKGAHKKSKKQETPPPPLPSGPTGPVQQIPLDSIAAVPPQVTYENNQLTINAPNSTLADILRAVRKLTGAETEVPAAPERVVTHLGPGPAREVVAELLNGSRFNYVLLGSPDNSAALTRVVLVAKTGTPEPTAPSPDPSMGQQAINQPQPPEAPQEAEADSSDDNSADDNSDQTAAEEQQQPQEQNGVKTPQQMLQEMQQRQMQMQQQQQQGQPPMPQGRPPGAPQQQQEQ